MGATWVNFGFFRVLGFESSGLFYLVSTSPIPPPPTLVVRYVVVILFGGMLL